VVSLMLFSFKERGIYEVKKSFSERIIIDF